MNFIATYERTCISRCLYNGTKALKKMENRHIGENNKRIYEVLFLFSLKRLVITVLSIIYILLEVSINQNKLEYSRKHLSFHQHNHIAFYLNKKWTTLTIQWEKNL